MADEFQVQIGVVCTACQGKGIIDLPPGQFSSGGHPFMKCGRCQETPGHTERRWVPLAELRDLLK